MDETYLELLEELGLVFDSDITVYTIPERISAQQALAQYDIFSDLNLSEEEMERILDFLYAVDRLNMKFLKTYDVDKADQVTIAGLEIAYERALGTIIYGFLYQLYLQFSVQPKVYQAIFGPNLGRVLFDYSLQLKPSYERLERLREQWQEAPDSFADLLIEELNDINLRQKQVAVELGLPEQTADSAARYLFNFHLHAEMIDFDAMDEEISASSNETVQRRIEEGKQSFPSEEYRMSEMLNHVKDDERRKKIFEAIQAAKDKDRANAGRLKEQSGSKRGSGLNPTDANTSE